MKKFTAIITLILVAAGLSGLKAETFYSVKHGNWEDTSTWSVGDKKKKAKRVPGPDDEVVIYTQVRFKGKLVIGPMGRVYIMGVGMLETTDGIEVRDGGRFENYAQSGEAEPDAVGDMSEGACPCDENDRIAEQGHRSGFAREGILYGSDTRGSNRGRLMPPLKTAGLLPARVRSAA